ncbi:MAG: C40 family peptidase [Eggerthellaceae bacterium]|nr:C40 family peptidase [Eggerthellaceae bacterium]
MSQTKPQNATKITRRTFLGASAAATLGVILTSPSLAKGETSAEKQNEADEARKKLVSIQADLEAAADTYYGFLEAKEDAEKAMNDASKRIEEAGDEIDRLITRLNVRARNMYRSGNTTFLDFLFGSTSFSDFVENWDTLNKLNAQDTADVAATKQLRVNIELDRASYAQQAVEAETAAREAKMVADEVAQRVAEAEALVAKLDAEALALLEAERAEAARKAAEERARKLEEERRRQEEEERRKLEELMRNNGNAPLHKEVVDYARTKLGCPYVWGGEGPNEFDCSGLVTWSYRQIGMRVRHYTEWQYKDADERVAVSEARPGDVLYRYGHVGIAEEYGGYPYIHAPTFNAYVRDTDKLSWAGFTLALRFY